MNPRLLLIFIIVALIGWVFFADYKPVTAPEESIIANKQTTETELSAEKTASTTDETTVSENDSPATTDTPTVENTTPSEITPTATTVPELPKDKPATPTTTTVNPSPTNTEKPISTKSPETTSPATPTSTFNLKWGAYVGYSDADLATFEKTIGKLVDMRGVFVNWNDPFPTSFSSLKNTGKTLVIYWELYGVTLDSILAGESDDYIKKFGEAARAYGGPVILAPLHEMNGNWDPWGGTVGNNTPQKVVTTWQRIVDKFGARQNVKFAWAVNNISVPNTKENAITVYYPGNNYVDFVAVDGFNFADPWQSFDEVFGEALQLLSKYQKPIYILSMATAEGERKATWIKDAIEVQMPKYPLLKGFIWFQENKERDWRIESDQNSLQAFQAALK